MTSRRQTWIAWLVFTNMLSGTLLIPAVRPLFAAVHPDHPDAVHAFFSVNMLGAAIGAPVVGWLADRTGRARPLLATLALVDAILLVACTVPLPLAAVLALRFVQGAANVGALSILMGAGAKMRAADAHRDGIGLSGVAVVVAIVVGAPLGALLVAIGPCAPFYVAAACAASVAGASATLPAAAEPARRGSMQALLTQTPILRVPTLFIGAERFVVGCFVVTFSLYAHDALGRSDAQVGALFSWFLVPFALLTWPFGVAVQRLDRGVLLTLGAAVYAACFLTLGEVGTAALPFVLALAGSASAAIYAPSLCIVAERTPHTMRATAMALANAGGTLGMLLGTATAGLLTVVLAHHGVARADVYPWVFRVAGFVQLAALVVGLPALRALAVAPAHTAGAR